MATNSRRLNTLPDEILLAIVLNLDEPESLQSLQLTSKKLKAVTDETVIWRKQCRNAYKYWHPRHRIQEKFSAPPAQVRWKLLFQRRRQTDARILYTLNDLLATQQERHLKMQRIAEEGYDAKDVLLQEHDHAGSMEDVLARRFHCEAILGMIHRRTAVQEWNELQGNSPIPLERALGAYDMFVLGAKSGDFKDISDRLDDIANAMRASHPDFDHLSIRNRALGLVQFLRAHNLTGIAHREQYTELQNNFLGIALHDARHQSLPLISVAIYCGVAERLGLTARPCGYPWHVYAIVSDSENETLDGGMRSSASTEREMMYLDPFRSDFEAPQSTLVQTLGTMGLPATDFDQYLGPASTKAIVLRSARNIMNSLQEMDGHGGLLQAVPAGESSVHPDTDSALYASLWALLMLHEGIQGSQPPARAMQLYLPHLVDRFTQRFPWDFALVEEFIVPRSHNHEGLIGILRELREEDRTPKVPHRRGGTIPGARHKVGQVFQHKRYGYEAVITGWDSKCAQNEDWIQQMGVDRLSGGREQSFYHVLWVANSHRLILIAH